MDYNLILKWYYYNQTGEWPNCGGETDPIWALFQNADGSMGYSFWNGSFAAPDLNDANIFNETNEALATTLSEQIRQDGKNIIWKMIDNAYIDFLTNEWTPLLRSYGIIAPDYTITVQNTDSATNMYWLLSLRVIDKTKYVYYSGEFDKFDRILIKMGGECADAVIHDLDNSSSSSETP